MISLKDIYSVVGAVIPLYVTMLLAYASVKWWKIFTTEQCSGINRFVATFAIPLLSFEFISRVDPFKMNFPFIAADSLSKAAILFLLSVFAKFSNRPGSLDWSITLFSLSTLPNTLVMGIPLLKSMYGSNQEGLMVQVVVLQSVIWYTLLLVLFEYRAARSLVKDPACSEGSGVRNVEQDDQVIVVDVIVPPPPENEQQQWVQMGNRVAPDSGEMRLEKGEEDSAKELHMFVWKCGCCASQGKLV